MRDKEKDQFDISTLFSCMHLHLANPATLGKSIRKQIVGSGSKNKKQSGPAARCTLCVASQPKGAGKQQKRANVKKSRSFGPTPGGSEPLMICLTCGGTFCMPLAVSSKLGLTAGGGGAGHVHSHFDKLKKHALFAVLNPRPDHLGQFYCASCQKLLSLPPPNEAIDLFSEDETLSSLLECFGLLVSDYGAAVAKMKEQEASAERLAALQATVAQERKREQPAVPRLAVKPPPVEPVDAEQLWHRLALLNQLNEQDRSSLKRQYGVRGLKNIGNTCFFNSVMQCLGQASDLVSHFLATQRKRPQGALAMALHQFLLNQWTPFDLAKHSSSELTSAMTSGALANVQQPSSNPATLFGEICRRAPRFYGRRQQDAHELLRFFIDGLVEEEMRKIKAVRKIIQQQNKAVSKKWSKEELDAAVAENFVIDLFSGELLSLITCHSCGTQTRTSETFFDLSLSIPSVARNDELARQPPSSTTAARKSPPLSKRQQKLQAKQMRQAKFREAKVKGTKPPGNSTTEGSLALGVSVADDDAPADIEPSDSLAKMIEENEEYEVAANLCSLFDSDPADHAGGDSDEEELLSAAIALSLESKSESSKSISCQTETDIKNTPDNEAETEAISVQEPSSGSSNKEKDIHEQPRGGEPEISLTRPRRTVATRWHNSSYDGLMNFCTGVDMKTNLNDSVEGCLMLFFQPESVENYSCDACARIAAGLPALADDGDDGDDDPEHLDPIRGLATKQYILQRPPRLLTIHLKRFRQAWGVVPGSKAKMRRGPGGLLKIDEFVQFSEHLDLTPFSEREPPVPSTSTSPHGQFVAQFVRDPVDRGNGDPAELRWHFRLVGVVQHGGSLSGGHYVAYFFHKQRRQWYFASDARVRPASIAEVLKSQAYLVFYEKIESFDESKSDLAPQENADFDVEAKVYANLLIETLKKSEE